MKLPYAFVITCCVSYFIFIPQACAQKSTNIFTESERIELSKSIQSEVKLSKKNISINQGFDIGFKIFLFAISALAAVGSAWVSTLGEEKTPPPWLKPTNLGLTTLTTLITGLAFTNFNFEKRQAIWNTRYQALDACNTALIFAQPDKENFLLQLEQIKRWDDYSNPSDLTASCNAKR
jgi:hypothetical protein